MRLINEERDQDKDIFRVSKKSAAEDKEWEKKQLSRMYTKAEMKRIPNEAFDDGWEEEFDIMKKFWIVLRNFNTDQGRFIKYKLNRKKDGEDAIPRALWLYR